MQVRFYDIEWDTDGEETDLPKEVTIELPEGKEPELDGVDILSDKFGFLIDEFKHEVLQHG